MADRDLGALKGRRFVASYSGGKDSALAIHRALRAEMVLQALLITYNTDRGRSWFHGIPPNVLRQVEEAVGCRVILVRTSGAEYAQNLEAELRRQVEAGAEYCVFGDIDIQEHMDWCSARCKPTGIGALFPLWKESREALVYEGLRAGFAPRITVVDTGRLDKRFLGQVLTKALAQEIQREGADICGENGEYHTFVAHGPIFAHPVPVAFGEPFMDGVYAILPMQDCGAVNP